MQVGYATMLPGRKSVPDYEFLGLGDIDGPKPYEFIGFGDIYDPKPYEFIGFGDIDGLEKPFPPQKTLYVGRRMRRNGISIDILG